MTLEELVGHMKIEEANRLKDKPFSNPTDSVKANIVETAGGSKNRFTKGGKGKSLSNKGNKPQFKKGANSNNNKVKVGLFYVWEIRS